ncbi:rhodanese-like domain-containing protein [Chloroflexota bacterium]
MKNGWVWGVLLSLLLIFGTILTGGCAGTDTITSEVPTLQVENVSTQEAYSLIQNNRNNPDFIILDVRTPEEFSVGHIDGAVNTDFYEDTFREELDALDRNTTYLVHCRSESRSQSTVDTLEALGFTKIYHMTGGYIEWEAEGLPTVK